jgi:hypothetical protein
MSFLLDLVDLTFEPGDTLLVLLAGVEGSFESGLPA